MGAAIFAAGALGYGLNFLFLTIERSSCTGRQITDPSWLKT
jgi:hypothetical protein